MSNAADLRAGLRADGFHRGSPSREVREQDAAVAAAVACPDCGHYGLSLETWIHDERFASRQGGYRALAVCPACPHGQEF